VFEIINKEIRKEFEILISDRRVVNLWLNIAELFTMLSNNISMQISYPILNKAGPLLESFLIIYQIMHGEETDIL